MIKWKVYPTEYVPGFVATYCKSEISAEWQQMRMQIATGVEWKIKRIN
jgi:hypothetical protein